MRATRARPPWSGRPNNGRYAPGRRLQAPHPARGEFEPYEGRNRDRRPEDGPHRADRDEAGLPGPPPSRLASLDRPVVPAVNPHARQLPGRLPMGPPQLGIDAV